MDYFPLVLQAVGGAVLGPFLSALTGGRGFGTLGNAIAGIIGGIGAGYVLTKANVDIGSMMGGGDLMRMLAEVVKGGIGGAALGILAGLIRRR